MMKNWFVLILLTVLLSFTGCGGGGGDSSTIAPTGNGTAYTVDNNSNNALMGPLKEANVSVYRLNDLSTPIETATTGDFGAFSVNLNGIPNSELLLVVVAGGKDIDSDDDGKLDSHPIDNKGVIHALATREDLKNGRCNVTLLSEILYRYVQHLVGKVHQVDLEQAMNLITTKLLNAKIERDVNTLSYRDVNNFNPINKNTLNQLTFDYRKLIAPGALAEIIHNDENSSVIEHELNSHFSSTLALRNLRLVEHPMFYRLELVKPLKANVTSNIDLKVDQESNTSKTITFVQKDANVTLTIIPSESMKIVGWNGCDKVSNDLATCTLTGVHENRILIPQVVYKNTEYDTKVKDLSKYFVSINDNNYTVSLDLDANSSQRDFLNGIEVGNIIMSANNSNRFFKKVVSKVQVDDYNYIFNVSDTSFLELYKQGGVSLSKHLTYNDLAKDVNTTNRSLVKHNMKLLPPKHQNDDTFVVKIGDFSGDNGRARAVEDSVNGEIEIVPGVKVSGTFSYKIDTDFAYNIDWFTLKSMHYVIKKELKTNLKITYTQQIKNFFEKKIPLGSRVNYRIPIPGAPLWVNVSVAFYLGYEGKVEAIATLSGEYSAVSQTGFNYIDGHVSTINNTSNAGTFNLSGEVKFSAGAYVLMTPQLTIVDVAGAGIDTKAGIYAENSSALGVSNNGGECTVSKGKAYGKLSAELRFVWAPWLNDHFEWARSLSEKINSKISEGGLKLELAREYPIKEWNFPCSAKPAFLEVYGDQISIDQFSDETLDKSYTLTVKNSGDKDMNWHIDVNGEMKDWISLSQTSGKLAKGESVDVMVLVQNSDLSLLSGDFRSTLSFVNDSANGSDTVTGNTNIDVMVHITPKLVKPIFSSIELKGESIKTIDVKWSYDHSQLIDGVKLYKKDCTNGNSGAYSLLSAFDGLTGEASLDYTRYKEQLLPGHTYCFNMTTYLDNVESEPTQDKELTIPEYASIISSIKDRNGNPLPDAHVYLTTLANNTVSDGNGDFVFENLLPGRYLITVNAEGYSPTSAEVTLDAGQRLIYEGQYVIEQSLADHIGTVHGRVRSAVDNSVGIANVTIQIRKNAGNISGEILKTVATDSNGDYTIELPSGTYTFTLSKEGYITDSATVLVIGDENTRKDLSMSPVLMSGQLRTTLRWGETPSDLDSHMVKYINGNQVYHIYYGNMSSGSDTLDTDDTTSYGPETVTVSSVDSNATYTYYVYNYTHGDPQELKNSNASVTVQTQEGSHTYYVPNEDGYYWKVYQVINGQIIPCTSGCVKSDEASMTRSLGDSDARIFQNLPSK